MPWLPPCLAVEYLLSNKCKKNLPSLTFVVCCRTDTLFHLSYQHLGMLTDTLTQGRLPSHGFTAIQSVSSASIQRKRNEINDGDMSHHMSVEVCFSTGTVVGLCKSLTRPAMF